MIPSKNEFSLRIPGKNLREKIELSLKNIHLGMYD